MSLGFKRLKGILKKQMGCWRLKREGLRASDLEPWEQQQTSRANGTGPFSRTAS